MTDEMIAQLGSVLDRLGAVAIAVSGGVDSMTLAWFAHRRSPERVTLYQARSPAVPVAATERVRDYAAKNAWRLEVIDAREFSDPSYRANPADRCLYCKRNLYGAIAMRTEARVASGTNLDDLDDYRPGLEAAQQFGVYHPYVEAGIGKAGVRALASHFGLRDLAQLPASPCLSSRIETGIRIETPDLDFIDQIETLLRAELSPEIIRCRRRRDGIVIEFDQAALQRVQSEDSSGLRARLNESCRARGFPEPRYEGYRRGSAFVLP
ncbi:MAG: hypothetical protein JOZ58_16310 [Acetobacteraceae bacterium]|nr:hypothetical protein [Acetobacteraceae bacterium]